MGHGRKPSPRSFTKQNYLTGEAVVNPGGRFAGLHIRDNR